MDLKNIHSIYFLGIGGIGMSALACYFHALGKAVTGYDKTPTRLTYNLQQEGIAIHYDENISKIPHVIDLVIYTPAIPQDNKEYQYFIKKNTQVRKRAEVLGKITEGIFTIAVAGTHGKTTITALITHLLKTAGKPVTAFIGGISKNYHSNLVMTENSQFMVVEADEYDRSFLNLYPDMAVITAIDADHLDIYFNQNNLLESFSIFTSQVRPHGKIVAKKGLDIRMNPDVDIKRYSVTEDADISILSHSIGNGYQTFDMKVDTRLIKDLSIGLPGLHNVENAIAAADIALELGIDEDRLKTGLASFQGVERRFDIRLHTPEIIFIDDYAHHPEEINACLSGVRDFFPGKKITGIFQPHLYSRTRDMADDFARILGKMDGIILLDVYPARELPIEGIDSQMILDKIRNKNKILTTRHELFDILKKQEIEVLLTLGAGDIDQLVQPIEDLLKEKYSVSID
jgi:UDP-N-acetylmuramate--alanine ligase